MDDTVKLSIGFYTLMILVMSILFGYDGFVFMLSIIGVYTWVGMLIFALMDE